MHFAFIYQDIRSSSTFAKKYLFVISLFFLHFRVNSVSCSLPKPLLLIAVIGDVASPCVYLFSHSSPPSSATCIYLESRQGCKYWQFLNSCGFAINEEMESDFLMLLSPSQIAVEGCNPPLAERRSCLRSRSHSSQ